MEVIYSCPNCKKQTMGVFRSGCQQNMICPICLKHGETIIMAEKSTNQSVRNLGDGLYSNADKNK